MGRTKIHTKWFDSLISRSRTLLTIALCFVVTLSLACSLGNFGTPDDSPRMSIDDIRSIANSHFGMVCRTPPNPDEFQVSYEGNGQWRVLAEKSDRRYVGVYNERSSAWAFVEIPRTCQRQLWQ